MGVTTRADENLEQIKSLVEQASDLLYETTQKECWGFEELYPDYQKQLKAAFLSLVQVRNNLDYTP